MLIERGLSEINLRGSKTDLYETKLTCHEVKAAREQRFKDDEEEIEIITKAIDREDRRIMNEIKKCAKTRAYEIPEEAEVTGTSSRIHVLRTT